MCGNGEELMNFGGLYGQKILSHAHVPKAVAFSVSTNQTKGPGALSCMSLSFTRFFLVHIWCLPIILFNFWPSWGHFPTLFSREKCWSEVFVVADTPLFFIALQSWWTSEKKSFLQVRTWFSRQEKVNYLRRKRRTRGNTAWPPKDA